MLAWSFLKISINVWSLIRACWVDYSWEINRRVDTIIRDSRVHQRHLKKENPGTQCNVQFRIKIQYNTNKSTNFFKLCTSKNGLFNQGLFCPRQAFPLSGVHIMNHLHFTTCGVELYFTACHKLARQKSHS